MTFRTNNSDAVTINSSGNVGIGTTGPKVKVDVSGALRLLDATYTGPTTGAGFELYYDTADSGANFMSIDRVGNVWKKLTIRALDVYLTPIGGNVIVSSGNVGIGTTGPGSPLEINSTALGQGIRLSSANVTTGNSSLGTNTWGSVSIGEVNEGGAVFLGISDSAKIAAYFQGVIGVESTTIPAISYTAQKVNGSTVAALTGTNMLYQWNNYNTPVMTFLANGNVGIGTTAPGYLLTMGIGGGYYNQATGAWTAGSDIAYKTNISDLTKYGLETVKNLRPVSYTVKQSGVDQVGFIAQEVKGLVPELVSGNDGSMGLNYGGFAPILVKAIQEQQLQIASLSGQLAPLLQVDGSCVTGDTLLPIRRRRKSLNGLKSEDDNLLFDYLLCRIDEILPGDEVSSLNEFTGSLEWHKISALKDMDIKEVFELTTKSGKVIRTTAKHPYLTLLEDNPVVSKGGIK
ncbi:MAG: tail fiber domain-containing protein [Patescibacteria group bacterium]